MGRWYIAMILFKTLWGLNKLVQVVDESLKLCLHLTYLSYVILRLNCLSRQGWSVLGSYFHFLLELPRGRHDPLVDLWRQVFGIPDLADVDIGHLLEIIHLDYDLIAIGKQAMCIAPRFGSRLCVVWVGPCWGHDLHFFHSQVLLSELGWFGLGLDELWLQLETLDDLLVRLRLFRLTEGVILRDWFLL